MSEEENIAVVKRFHDELIINNLSIINELISPNFVSHSKNMSSNKEEIMRDQAETVSSTEDRELTYRYSARGDWVLVRCQWTFRIIRPFMGRMPDGQWHTLDELAAYRVENGKIVEFRDDIDPRR